MILKSLATFSLAAAVLTSAAFAQGYPKIPPAVQQPADEQKAAADKRSDDAFAKAQPEIEAWAAKGKLYVPNAGETSYHILDTKSAAEIEAWINREKFNGTKGGGVYEELPQATIPAFPGAEGGGMYSFGGRGGKVFVVTNLNDSGLGSFREACEAAGPRVIVFNVAGIIRLKDRIRVRAPYITIAGNTAPGDGVCIAGNTVELETHDIIIRYMRFRRGALEVTDRNDSFGGNPVGNLIIDHVSASWGLDENMSMYRHMYRPKSGKELKLPTVNVTIQNSIFSEALNTYHHAFGSTIGGMNSTFHHNLWACNTGRNPSVGMYGDFTFANNVVFNWRHRTTDGGDHRSFYNIINNYYKPGPGTPKEAVSHRLLKPESERSKTIANHYGKAYVNGNVVEGNERVTKDNWDGGVQPAVETKEEVREELMKKAPSDPEKLAAYKADVEAKLAQLKLVTTSEAEALKSIRVNEPFTHAPLTIQPAAEAYSFVLANVGATLPKRDAVDQRVIEMVRTGKVGNATMAEGTPPRVLAVGYKQEVLDEQKELVTKGFITDPSEVGGYPKYEGTPYKDSDGDGMPDEWEITHKLDPKNPADANTVDKGGYTFIEDFINSRDPHAK
ncbi:MAG: hypothetical protein QM790_04775 [Nibricoccus sp.]